MALAGLALLGGGCGWGAWHRPSPGFLGKMAALNNRAAIKRYCRAHTVEQDGGTACELGMVWVRRFGD